VPIPLILALDIGTSSVRASLYDERAVAVPQASVKVENRFKTTADGGFEIDAENAFSVVVAAIDELLAKTERRRSEVSAVAVCAFWHSLVGIDGKGKPMTPVLGWADTRARKYTAILRTRFDEKAVHSRTGARLHSSYWPAKLMWLRKERPDIFSKTEKWLSFADFVALRFFGETATSVSMASGTGIVDIRKCTWDADILKAIKIRTSQLPEVAGDNVRFILNKKFAKRWPRLAGSEWFPAIGDGAADTVGSGCIDNNKATLMIGTSGAMRVAFTGKPPANLPDGVWCYRIDRERVIVGGALSDGGGLVRWLKDNLRMPVNAERQIAAREVGAHGISFLPFLAGERGTGYHENASAAILGLTLDNDAVDILQAALESVAFRFAEIFDQLRTITRINEIVASGGALRDSTVWPQIIADVLGQDLIMTDAEESSSRGAVLHTLKSQGKIGKFNSQSKAGIRTIRTNRKRFNAFSEARKAHAGFYKLLIEKAQ
jgi:gluconokinase